MLSRAILSAALVASASAAASPLRIDGLVAAVFSPFDKDSNLDLSVVPAQHAYLNATGVDWVFVGGTTGESLKLTKDERKDLNVAWIKAGSNVIAHCGAERYGPWQAHA
jgi:N-acetylneuraminate lyase